MRLLILKIAICLTLCACAVISASAQQGGKTHILLLDHSGSMNERYKNNYRDWLIRPLLRTSAFSEGDQIIVRWFTQRGRIEFDPKDSQVKLRNVKYNEQEVINNIPEGADLHADTDIPEALELALKDIEGYSITGDVFIWLITDNDQDNGHSRDITPLYKRITDNKNFRAAYLFPLVRENHEQLGSGKSAMIMYLLNYSTKAPSPLLDHLAQEVASKIENPVITWFPLERAVIPSPDPVTDEDTQVIGDTLILPPVNEGESPNFNSIKFAFKSQLRNRSISGRINPAASVDLAWPPSIRAEGASPQTETPKAEDTPSDEAPVEETAVSETQAGTSNWEAHIQPSELSLSPGKSSSTVYTVSMSSPVTLHPSGFMNGFWTALLSSESEPVTGTIQIQVSDLKTDVQMEDGMLSNVQNGGQIKRIVGQSDLPNASFPITVSFHVNYDSWWRRLVAIVVALVIIIALIVLLSLALHKTRYVLSAPGGERELALPLIGKEYISLNGNQIAVINKSFSRLTVKPLDEYTIDGSSNARAVSDKGESFSIEHRQDGTRYTHTLRRADRAVPVKATRDKFLD